MIPDNVSIVILTYNAAAWAPRQITGLKLTGVQPRQVLVVDSTSSDETVALYRKFGAEVVVIPQSSFNHGSTRRFAAKLLSDRELLIFLTQDAIPADTNSFAAIIRAFDDPMVGMAYGRQLPRLEANAIEAHARLFNYSERSDSVRLTDCKRLGSKATFASDSFAAYRSSTLHNIGSFPEDVFFAEDQIVAAKMLLSRH
ncbi:glycosyltransferase [Nevskia sp.]|uniref:glycosyltransferase family 2 protein n=1 Tax=Nevskia sp. TaxID=1929292 RepID=UPI0025E66766|nr:glycosyltransferase [Nevskia sp.]